MGSGHVVNILDIGLPFVVERGDLRLNLTSQVGVATGFLQDSGDGLQGFNLGLLLVADDTNDLYKLGELAWHRSGLGDSLNVQHLAHKQFVHELGFVHVVGDWHATDPVLEQFTWGALVLNDLSEG